MGQSINWKVRRALAFNYQTAIITGGSSGIGKALAFALAKRGCKVGLIARREDELRDICQTLTAAGATAVYACADITDADSVQNAVNKIEAEIGGTELLIANAGISIRVHARSFDPKKVAQIYNVNVLGLNYAIAAVLNGMMHRKNGHIVGISSLASYRGIAGHSSYCGSKAAVNTQLEGLRVELRAFNVKVTTICPGYIQTAMLAHHTFKPPFIISADEAAERIVSAIARGRRRYDFPWQTTLGARIMAILPAFIYDRLPQPYKNM